MSSSHSSSSAAAANGRLSALPRIPKKAAKKAPKTRSPPKHRHRPLPPPPPSLPSNPLNAIPKAPKAMRAGLPPRPNAPLAAAPKPPAPAAPAPTGKPVTLTLSDDDTLSELSSLSGSSSESEDSDDEEDSDEDGKPAKTPAVARPFMFPGFPGFSSLPALPPLPPLSALPPIPKAAAAPPKPAPSPAARPASPSKPKAPTSLPSIPKKPLAPAPPASSSAAAPKPRPSKPPPPPAPAPKPISSAAPSRSKPFSRAPSETFDRTPSSSYVPPSPARAAPSGRMSLRQVLALSLQEAQEEAASRASSAYGTRENSPDATQLSERAKGAGKAQLSDLSSAASSSSSEDEGPQSESEGGGSSTDDSGEDDGLELQKEEERLLRREIERRRKRSFGASTADGMDVDGQESSDEELGAEAWERNVRALERLHQRRSGGGGAEDVSMEAGEDSEDSDLAITEVPPGNGLGVVTWSDYDSFDEGDGFDDLGLDFFGGVGEGGEDSSFSALPAVVEGEGDTPALAFEDELEELFALSEAVVGPIQQSEYELGNLWLEALSASDDDDEGTEGDDESGSSAGEDEEEAEGAEGMEMIFGPDGELKRLFGGRSGGSRKRRASEAGFAAFEGSSAGESSDGESAAGDDDAEAVELIRIGVSLAPPSATGSAAASPSALPATAEQHLGDDETEDEQTDSSCSDTDIYRYAPRTGSLSALQAPTMADLASLNGEGVVVDQPSGKKKASVSSAAPAKSHPAPSSATPSPAAAVAAARQKQQAKRARLPAIVEEGTAAQKQQPQRKGPTMGTFDTAARKAEDGRAPLTVVVIDESGVPVPSPFSVQRKAKRRALDLTPSRRSRSNSRVSTTSATSGSLSTGDLGSNIGSPVLANVDLGFDLDSVLHESALFTNAGDTAESSSETDAGAASGEAGGTTPKASALADFSRWSRIPIGAFRSRTMRGPGDAAPSQVFAAKAAAKEEAKAKRKRARAAAASGESGAESTAATAAQNPRKTLKKAHSAPIVAASSLLRDHKAAGASLQHTLGGATTAGGKKGAASSKRKIASRMLTSPVLGPVALPPTAAAGSAALSAAKKAKRSKRTTPAGSVRGKSPAGSSRARSGSRSREQSRQPVGAGLSAEATASLLTAPTAGLAPLHSPLFKNVDLH
ncbi:hypothetical protein JCM10213_001958 [Rhodosporidiobolus nylandii]